MAKQATFRLETCSLGKPPARFARLMRSCFFSGAMNAVFLLHKGYDDQLASDIASLHLGTAAVVKPNGFVRQSGGAQLTYPAVGKSTWNEHGYS
jgi:hypothetical protein